MHPFLTNQLAVLHQYDLRREASATHGCVAEEKASVEHRPEPDQRTHWAPKECPQ